ncbi:MAG TPA: hypothetical protein VFV50_14110 [Bdellovibrionales bacterium]|nr:hypothetical protein [Bdellovibrionales bacterium]
MRSYKWPVTEILLSASCAAIVGAALLPAGGARAGDWSQHEVSIRQTALKIQAKEQSIVQLIEAKKTITDQQQMSETLTKISAEHKELEKLYDDFNKERTHTRFEHPEQGARLDRQYRPLRLKTLNEFETEGGIDGRLTELKKKVSQKYGEPVKPQPQATPYVPTRNKAAEDAEREKKRIKLSK